MDAQGNPSAKEKLIIEMSGRLTPIPDIVKATGLTESSVYSVRTRFKADIEALENQSRATLIEQMSGDLKEAGATIARKYRQRALEMAESGELNDKVALQILKLAAGHFVEKPTARSEQIHVHLTLEQQVRAAEGAKEIEADWARPQGAIEAKPVGD
jgi:hypothetical protein